MNMIWILVIDNDLENWQSAMKVGDDVYMIESYGFIANGQEHIVFYYISPFLDLSKPPEVGTFVLIRQSNIFVIEQNIY